MPNSVKILAFGDVVGRYARHLIVEKINLLKEKYHADIVMVNVENSTHGNGLSYKNYLEYDKTCIDIMSMGNHTFGKKEIYNYISKAPKLLVPANIPDLPESFDSHYQICIEFKGYKIKFINILGNHNMDYLKPTSYLKCFDKFYDNESIYIVDFHAELTAEKLIMGYFADGRASFVFGTHTHVQTADSRILPNGCAYITDIGMCGSLDSVIGYDKDLFVQRVAGLDVKATVSKEKPLMVNGCLVEIDLDTKKAISIERINLNSLEI